MSAQHTPGQVTLQLYEHGKPCLMGVTSEAKYHIWLDPISLLPVDHIVYKNPPGGAAFPARTIKLDARRGGGKQVADAMLPQVHALFPAAKAKLERELERKRLEAEAARANSLAEAAGPELLSALRRLVAADHAITKAFSEGPTDRDISSELRALRDAHREAAAAIAKATGAPA